MRNGKDSVNKRQELDTEIQIKQEKIKMNDKKCLWRRQNKARNGDVQKKKLNQN